MKHCLLQNYLPELIYKISQKWDSIVYIDGFAGPWNTKDPTYQDSSFGIAIGVLRECQRGLRERYDRKLHVESILVEPRKEAYSQLKRFANDNNSSDFQVHALTGEFVAEIPTIERLISQQGKESFRFVFLDPTGWAQIPMRPLQSLLTRSRSEVLINLMTSHIVRFLDEEDRSESYHALFGRDKVLELLHQTPQEERTDLVVQEYGQSLRTLCHFKYFSSAAILDPLQERIKYFLIYGTNHSRGVEVFKTAELKASKLQDAVRHDAQIRKTRQPPLLFDQSPPSSRLSLELRDRYSDQARTKLLSLLSSKATHTKIPYKDLFCEAMAFPLVTPTALANWLKDLEPHVKMEWDPTTQSRRKPAPQTEDSVVVINPQALSLMFKPESNPR